MAFAPVGVITGLLCGWWSHKGRIWPVVPMFVFSLPAMLAVHAVSVGVDDVTMGTSAMRVLHALQPTARVGMLAAMVGLPGLFVMLGGLAIAGVASSRPSWRTATPVLVVGLLAAGLVLMAGWAGEELFLGKRRAGVVAVASLLAGIGAGEQGDRERPLIAFGSIALSVGFVELWWTSHAVTESLSALDMVPTERRERLLDASLPYIEVCRPWQWAALAVPTVALLVRLQQTRWDEDWRAAVGGCALIGSIAASASWVADSTAVAHLVLDAFLWW